MTENFVRYFLKYKCVKKNQKQIEIVSNWSERHDNEGDDKNKMSCHEESREDQKRDSIYCCVTYTVSRVKSSCVVAVVVVIQVACLSLTKSRIQLS